ncbi:hypothetical protein WJX74_010892 [Apatococcus lobatus]|uniref:Uncharacterized protein n=1 Tax=Apatococcus lobatus TaxID=904363 RepID=A0AAW1RIB1_9CHLO
MTRRGRRSLCSWAVLLTLCQYGSSSAALRQAEGTAAQVQPGSNLAFTQHQQGRTLLQELSVLEAEVDESPEQQSEQKLQWAQQRNAPYQLSIPGGQCPHTFHRLEFDQVKQGHAKPYILGGDQQPECTNCKRDEERTHFCRFAPYGLPPICPSRDQDWFLNYFMEEVDKGSVYAKGLLELTPCDLWPYIRGKTIWLIGDSIMQEHQQALSCFFLEFWPSLERAPISEDQALIDALLLDPEVGPFPWCAELVEGTRICHFRSNWGWQLIDTVLPLLPQLTQPGDLWIQNIGVWYNDPDSLRVDMNRFGQYYADHKHELPTMLWRQSSVQHFPLSPTGDFGGFWLPPHFPCKPIGGEMDSITVDPGTGHLVTDRPDLNIVQKGNFRNAVTNAIAEQMGIPVMQNWNQTVPIWQLHHHYHARWAHAGYSNGDCTHHCHPGMYEMWTYDLFLLFKQLEADGISSW